MSNTFGFEGLSNTFVKYTNARKLKVVVKKTTTEFTSIRYIINTNIGSTLKFQISARYRENGGKGVILWINNKFINKIIFKVDAVTHYIHEYNATTTKAVVNLAFIQPHKGDILYLINFDVFTIQKQKITHSTIKLKEIEENVNDVCSKKTKSVKVSSISKPRTISTQTLPMATVPTTATAMTSTVSTTTSTTTSVATHMMKNDRSDSNIDIDTLIPKYILPSEKDISSIVNQYMEKYKLNKEVKLVVTSIQHHYNDSFNCAYNFIKMFRYYGLKCAGIFFPYMENLKDETDINIDSEQLGNIWLFKKNTLSEIQTYLNTVSPTYVFAFDFLSPKLTHEIFPNSTLVYMVTMPYQCYVLSTKYISARQFMSNLQIPESDANFDMAEIKSEIQSISKSDNIITTSNFEKNLLKKLYPNFSSFIIDNSINIGVLSLDKELLVKLSPDECLYNDFNTRNYDILFIVNNANPFEQIKNLPFILDLFQHHSLKMLRKLVLIVNENNEESETLNITNVGEIEQITIVVNDFTNDCLYKYLKQTKLILIPSYYDTCSTIIYDSILNGCIPLTSKNFGNYEILDEVLVCEDVIDINEWIAHIYRILKNGSEIQSILPDVHEIYNENLELFKTEFDFEFR